MNRPLNLLLALAINAFSFAQIEGIYVSDAGNFSSPPWQVIKYDENGQNPVQFIGNADLNWPQDILFMDSIEVVFISNLGSNKISRHNATTGAYISDFAVGISGPTRMKVGPDSLLYVLQWSGSNLVKRYELNGTYVDDFTSVAVPQSIGLDWDGAGNLYVSSYSGDLVRHFDPLGNDLGVFIDSNLVGPTNIWFDGGELLVMDYDGGAVKRFSSNGAYMGVYVPGLSNPEGVAYYDDGRFLIGNGGTGSVRQYDANGQYIQDLVSSGAGGLLRPNAVVIRKVAQVGIEETLAEQDMINVDRTVGDVFQFELDTNELMELRVLSMAGDTVAQLKGRKWVANDVPAGMYVVRASWKDGRTAALPLEVMH